MNVKAGSAEKSTSTSPAKRVPHTFVILFGIIVLLGIATYFIPAGQYDTEVDDSGRELVVSGTYHSVDSAPAHPFDLFTSILSRLTDGASHLFSISLCIGALMF